jgi:hypothetical protein
VTQEFPRKEGAQDQRIKPTEDAVTTPAGGLGTSLPAKKACKSPDQRCDAALQFGASVDLSLGTGCFQSGNAGKRNGWRTAKTIRQAIAGVRLASVRREVWFTNSNSRLCHFLGSAQPRIIRQRMAKKTLSGTWSFNFKAQNLNEILWFCFFHVSGFLFVLVITLLDTPSATTLGDWRSQAESRHLTARNAKSCRESRNLWLSLGFRPR